MLIRYCKSRWEYDAVPFSVYLDRIVSDGFDGAEVFLLPEKEEAGAIRDGIQERGLHFIAQVICIGETVGEHLAAMEAQTARAAACGADSINCHTGSDFYSFDENLSLFRRSAELSQKHGISIRHETHRGRALFSLPETVRYLDALPDLELTADLSHFMCVHESDLQGKRHAALLDRVIARTRHIHARVGFQQGPQVAHPLAPEHAALLEYYRGWWQRMVEVVAASNAPYATVVPEAGPPAYMPVLPFTGLPVADAWTVNTEMKDWLKSRLG